MANSVNVLDSGKKLRILKNYINGLTDKKGFLCLKGYKDFDDIISKPSSDSFKKYTFDNLTADIDKLVKNTRGKFLQIS